MKPSIRTGLDLAVQALVREAGPPAGHGFDLQAQELGGQGAGGGGVADPHFTGQEDLIALGLHVSHQTQACQDGPLSLLPAHGRSLAHIFCTGCDPTVQNAGMGQGLEHTHIHRMDMGPGPVCHDAD